MAKGENDARTRLQRAALELFARRGFERTTAAEIAQIAGVTERTFFRQFPDKREVLFSGEGDMRDLPTASIAHAPAGLGPLDTLFQASRSLGQAHEESRPFLKLRLDIISTAPALHERELVKIAALADALAAALTASRTFALHSRPEPAWPRSCTRRPRGWRIRRLNSASGSNSPPAS